MTWNLSSYQVPKEIGKVGAESPTFIQPIANRKDGIQAMFSRQQQTQSSPAKNSSQKRKRSLSPSTSHAPVETEVPWSKKPNGKEKHEDQDEEIIWTDHLPSPTPKIHVCLFMLQTMVAAHCYAKESLSKSRSLVRTSKVPNVCLFAMMLHLADIDY
jgi:hypothetical protein